MLLTAARQGPQALRAQVIGGLGIQSAFDTGFHHGDLESSHQTIWSDGAFGSGLMPNRCGHDRSLPVTRQLRVMGGAEQEEREKVKDQSKTKTRLSFWLLLSSFLFPLPLLAFLVRATAHHGSHIPNFQDRLAHPFEFVLMAQLEAQFDPGIVGAMNAGPEF
jgi:hypothetical protein